MNNNNPFKIESNNKKFFTSLSNQPFGSIAEEHEDGSYNRIKRINQQLQDLAKKKLETLFKEEQLDYIFKKQQPSMALTDFARQRDPKDKKYRIRALLKQKKESINQFLNKKKQIYLSKMNINIKKEQTQKLQDYIKDQEETLKARKLYFQNDVQFMHRFIDGIKKQAEDAQLAVQNQQKIQETLMSKINGLDAETEKIDNLKSKDQEYLHNLKKYKAFIDSFYNSQRNWKHYVRKSLSDEPLYLTQGKPGQQDRQQEQLIIRFQPSDMLQIFVNAEENNIRQIQNLHDKQDQLESVLKEESRQQRAFQKIMRQNEQKIDALQKKYQKKHFECSKLRQRRKNNSNNKISILDNEDLDLQKLGVKIFDLYRQVNDGKDQRDEKDIKKAMTQIERDIQKLRQQIRKQKQLHPNLITQIQRQMRNNQRKQLHLLKQEQAKQLEIKKQKEQQKKRNEAQIQKVKGRKDMRKVLVEKKVSKKKQVDTKTDDDLEKYLADQDYQ